LPRAIAAPNARAVAVASTERSIAGANSHPDVISIAGVSVRRERVGYSSQGPGRLAKQKPDAEVRQDLGLRSGQIDPDFGVIDVAPNEHLYAVMLEEDGVELAEKRKGFEGSFANPRIQPFGANGG
jgi:hypothetical protein